MSKYYKMSAKDNEESEDLIDELPGEDEEITDEFDDEDFIDDYDDDFGYDDGYDEEFYDD